MPAATASSAAAAAVPATMSAAAAMATTVSATATVSAAAPRQQEILRRFGVAFPVKHVEGRQADVGYLFLAERDPERGPFELQARWGHAGRRAARGSQGQACGTQYRQGYVSALETSIFSLRRLLRPHRDKPFMLKHEVAIR